MTIPRERVTFRFARAGGPGGQNVNKVETKVEVRFVLAEADWLPARVQRRIRELYSSSINKAGELRVASERFRTRSQNLEDCIAKLESLIKVASRVVKRRIATAPTRASKERRVRHKKARGAKKRSRGRVSANGD